MLFTDLIKIKSDGGRLTQPEIAWMVSAFTAGEIPDYQMAAMLMAIRLRGMTMEETANLTVEMIHSGEVADLSDLPGVKLDKHSTGGVGDTTTLVVAPLVAACGGTVAKMSGRGLGHTGGTLDKLEAIPGCRVDIPMEEFRAIVRDIGLAVVGQTDNLVPADKKIYALRDVTSTVRSIPLITSSIMSKKLASGADAIVLDVKTGSGAFMEKMKDARSLARQMVEIGWQLDRRVSAVITDMNQPLGMAVGNALEVREAVELLSGRIPAGDPLYEVCMVLAGQMLLLGGLVFSETEARQKLEEALHSGAGLEKLRQMVARQGGDETVLTPEGMDALCAVRQKVAFCAERDGYVSEMNAALIGSCAQLLGAGRAKKGDPIDPAVGLVMSVRRGDAVHAGDTLCTLYVNDDANLPEVRRRLGRAITVAPEPPESIPVVYEVIGGEGT